MSRLVQFSTWRGHHRKPGRDPPLVPKSWVFHPPPTRLIVSALQAGKGRAHFLPGKEILTGRECVYGMKVSNHTDLGDCRRGKEEARRTGKEGAHGSSGWAQLRGSVTCMERYKDPASIRLGLRKEGQPRIGGGKGAPRIHVSESGPRELMGLCLSEVLACHPHPHY